MRFAFADPSKANRQIIDQQSKPKPRRRPIKVLPGRLLGCCTHVDAATLKKFGRGVKKCWDTDGARWAIGFITLGSLAMNVYTWSRSGQPANC